MRSYSPVMFLAHDIGKIKIIIWEIPLFLWLIPKLNLYQHPPTSSFFMCPWTRYDSSSLSPIGLHLLIAFFPYIFRGFVPLQLFLLYIALSVLPVFYFIIHLKKFPSSPILNEQNWILCRKTNKTKSIIKTFLLALIVVWLQYWYFILTYRL